MHPSDTEHVVTSIPFVHTGLEMTLGIIVIVFITVLIEAHILKKRGAAYDWKEAWASAFISAGHHTTNLFAVLVWGWVFLAAWNFRFFTVPMDTWWGLLLLFLGEEFFYYWSHRFCHEIRWFWASHAVHHSPRNVNFSTAVRLGWTESITGLGLVYLPMMLLGFSPEAVFTVLAGNLLYQIWVHTEVIPKLGWIDLVLNTPYNHRVHHACNKECVDMNYGGVLMIYDHLFGTYLYDHPKEAFKYGVPGMTNTRNPFKVVKHEWARIFREARSKKSLRAGLRHLFVPNS